MEHIALVHTTAQEHLIFSEETLWVSVLQVAERDSDRESAILQVVVGVFSLRQDS